MRVTDATGATVVSAALRTAPATGEARRFVKDPALRTEPVCIRDDLLPGTSFEVSYGVVFILRNPSQWLSRAE